jgi:Leucine-rich repeat (LRR) protein
MLFVEVASCQSAGPTNQSPFVAACSGKSKNPTVDALITAAEQIVGPVSGEDRCWVYERALQKLTGLEMSCAGLSDLRPLSGFTNLESLTLSNNKIVDLSPLMSLKHLTALDVTSNKVKDLAPLSGIATLVFLGASGNQIADVTPLQHLAQLSSVHLEQNSIHDVKPLGSLNADLISIGNNQVTDIGELSHMSKVVRIYANGNKIKTVSNFSPPATLTIINLSTNPISEDEIGGLSQKMGIPDKYGNKKVVFIAGEVFNQDVDFVPTSRVIKVKLP